MRVLHGVGAFRKDAKKPLVLALGNFDGIHRGHARLLDYVVTQARRLQGRAAVFTFREHPQHILHPSHAPENLQSVEQRLRIFKSRGIDLCLLQRFDHRFAALTARDFVSDILVKKLKIDEICLGYNARFGQGREGDADLLREMGAKLGFEVCQMEPVTVRGRPVSSTAVREMIRSGKMEDAAVFLDRPWSIVGKVIAGKKRGHPLGFPTANLLPGDFVRPPLGVYAVRAQVFSPEPKSKRKALEGVLNFGVRPTFGGTTKPFYEAHFFDFHGNLYGKKVEIFFFKKIRNEKKFKSPSALKHQIIKDVHSAKRILKGGKTHG